MVNSFLLSLLDDEVFSRVERIIRLRPHTTTELYMKIHIFFPPEFEVSSFFPSLLNLVVIWDLLKLTSNQTRSNVNKVESDHVLLITRSTPSSVG